MAALPTPTVTALGSLDHLGIVAGMYDELTIGSIIDRCIPKTRHHHLTHGQTVKAMTLNSLGFVERRLYLFQDFFETISVEGLLGEGVTLEHLTDDCLGRTLDAIAAYGPTRLFNEIVVSTALETELGTELVHVDTTNFSVYGDYDPDFNCSSIAITKGFPKDGRWDLNRFVYGLATNQVGIPLFMQTFSGNESDKQSIIAMIETLQQNLVFDRKVYYVADSALYSAENLTRLNRSFWITRVPATVGGVQELCDTDEPFEPCTDPRYTYRQIETTYGGVRQLWVVYQSAELQARQEKTFPTVIEKELARARTALGKVTRPEYACEEDARRALKRWSVEHPECAIASAEIRAVARKTTGTRGRPRNGEAMETGYKVEVTIEPNDAWYTRKRLKLGRFVLATNDLDLSPDRLLAQYKNQGTVERGFRFLKDNAFRVSEVFLKKPTRIEALAMIMTLSLFIYSLTEVRVRKALKERNETVPNPERRPTQKPTLKRIFFLFRGVQVLEMTWEGKAVQTIHGLKDVMNQILRLLGPACEKYYRLGNYCGM
jgi:transposase